MAYSPSAHDTLYIDGVLYSIAEHPSAPGIPYGQEGRAAIVYRLIADETNETRAFKVFKPRFQIPALVGLAERLEAFSAMPGLQVCHRQVITARRNIELVRQHPGLSYAVLMPWIDGPTWMEVLLEGRAITPEQSLLLARSITEIFAGMEERGLAHCDLSGPNVLLPVLDDGRRTTDDSSASSRIELVDVEQMFGEDLKRPEFVPAGSSGYAHKTAAEGLWNARADRFAGALLIAEMLGWCDERVRKASWGESYFDPEEMQQDTERYRLLYSTLKNLWGESAAQLLEQSWESDSLTDCATFGQWIAAIPDHVPASALAPRPAAPEKTQPSPPAQVAPTSASTATTDGSVSDTTVITKPRETSSLPRYVREMLDEARRFEESGNLANALSTYREVLSMAPAGSGLVTEIPLIISQLEAKQPVSAPSNAAQLQTAPTPPVATKQAPEPAPTPKPQPPAEQKVAAPTTPAPAKEDFVLPARQPRPQQADATSSGAKSLPLVPIILTTVALLVVGIIAFFVLQPATPPPVQANNTPVPTSLANITPAAPTAVTITGLSVTPLLTLSAHTDEVTGVAFSPDGRILATSSKDGTTKLWNTNDGTQLQSLSGGSIPIFCVAYSSDGQTVMSGLADGSTRFWNASDGKEVGSFSNSTFSASKVVYSPDGSILAIGYANGEITLLKTEDKTELRTLKGKVAYVHSLAFSPDGETLYTGSLENKIEIWKVADGSSLSTTFGTDTDSMALSSDGQTIALGLKGKVELWSVATSQLLNTLQMGTTDVWSVAFSHDGQLLAAGDKDGTIKIFRASDGQELTTLKSHTQTVNSLAFTIDGNTLASGSKDKSAIIWKVSRAQGSLPEKAALLGQALPGEPKR